MSSACGMTAIDACTARPKRNNRNSCEQIADSYERDLFFFCPIRISVPELSYSGTAGEGFIVIMFSVKASTER